MDSSQNSEVEKFNDDDRFSSFLIKPFEKAYYNTYLEWFENEKIKASLYGIDQEWLDHILKDKSGSEYMVLDDEELIAVVGVEFPTSENASYAITNLAVNPRLLRRGIGAHVLELLYQIHSLKVDESWIAFVEDKNEAAQSFFSKNGWIEEVKEDGMIKFRKQ